jgi:hypothetical protein
MTCNPHDVAPSADAYSAKSQLIPLQLCYVSALPVLGQAAPELYVTPMPQLIPLQHCYVSALPVLGQAAPELYVTPMPQQAAALLPAGSSCRKACLRPHTLPRQENIITYVPSRGTFICVLADSVWACHFTSEVWPRGRCTKSTQVLFVYCACCALQLHKETICLRTISSCSIDNLADAIRVQGPIKLPPHGNPIPLAGRFGLLESTVL